MSESREDVAVRFAGAADYSGLAELIGRFMAHEGIAGSRPVAAAELDRWLGGPAPMFEALVAERAGALIGYLAFYRAFSVFRGGQVLLVENLFVDEAARGLGVGRRLLAAAAREAAARGWRRIELHVRSASREAQGFYQALGLTAPGESVLRIEDQALAALARSAAPEGVA